MRSPKKHLVLDASAIVNFWLNPEAGSPIARLFQAAETETSAAQLWIAAAMIPTLEYVQAAVVQRQCQATGKRYRLQSDVLMVLED